MRVRFRTYCYGCRRGWRIGDRWHRTYAAGRHRWEWAYTIACDGRALLYRQGFATFDRAWQSARRSYIKLANLACINAIAAGTEGATP